MTNSETLFIVYHGSLDVRLHRNIPDTAPHVCTVIMLETYNGRIVDAKRGLLNRSGFALEAWTLPGWRLHEVLSDVRENRTGLTGLSVTLNSSEYPIEEN